MTKSFGELEASIQAKIDSDSEFQSSLDNLNEEEKEAQIASKKSELLDQEIANLHEKSEKLTKAEELANNYKIRAEKAEKGAKGEGEPKPNAPESLSPKDYLALTEHKVSADDFDEVIRVAKILDKPINEALKDDTMKTIIANRVEQRQTANATQIKSPRGKQSDSYESLSSKAHKGQLAEEDIDKLVELEMAQKLAKKR